MGKVSGKVDIEAENPETSKWVGRNHVKWI